MLLINTVFTSTSTRPRDASISSLAKMEKFLKSSWTARPLIRPRSWMHASVSRSRTEAKIKTELLFLWRALTCPHGDGVHPCQGVRSCPSFALMPEVCAHFHGLQSWLSFVLAHGLPPLS